MKAYNINTEYANAKKISDLLWNCISDQNITLKERKQFQKEYMVSAKYALKLKTEIKMSELRKQYS